MTDLPFAGGADTTVGPVPGYYADPSIPGYVRYWGGTAWVPGTSRPTPAEGEVLEPPRFLGRPGRPAGARYVPPPSGSGLAAEGGTGAGTGAGPGAGPGGRPDGAGGAAGTAGTGTGGGPGGGTVLSPGDTGPVYFDQTTGGASFVLAPQAELELRRQADIAAWAAQEQSAAHGSVPAHGQAPGQAHGHGPGPGEAKAQWGGHPFSSPLPAADEERAPQVAGAVLRVAEPVLRNAAAAASASRAEAPTTYADPQPAPVPHQSTGGAEPAGPLPSVGSSGWQADPRAQRGLLETGGSPRWVSWGVLPGAEAPPEALSETPSEIQAWPMSQERPGHRSAANPEAATEIQPATPEPTPTKVAAWSRVELRGEPRTEPEAGPAPAAGVDDGPASGVTAASPGSGPAPSPAGRPAALLPGPAAAPDGRTAARTDGGAAGAAAPASAADRPPAADRGTAVGRGATTGRAAAAVSVSVATTAAATAGARSGPAAAGPARRPSATRRPAPRPAAGLVRRLVARIVDTTVMAIVAVAAGLPLASAATEHVQDKLDRARTASTLAGRQVQVWLVDGVVMGKAGVLLAVLLFVGVLYEVLPTARTGQTFGKRLMGIRVVDATVEARPPARGQGGARGKESATARPGARSGTAAPQAKQRPGGAGTPTLGRSFLRWIVRQLASVLVIGLCWPLFDRKARRGWQDRAARTRVVRA
ncbi:RDD family protein [Kitasatospora sp. NBC_00240]|uniref:RDD family protein n=1 Tax=Kitasatospora sp. NBC_00240 TaxID=2903567 RepID=UPI002250DA1E|nr:RDD family protein [Kitasatospora sp. NBC_00240]MCX5212687.1 RDD family protein [Kitasatospora sp. NBC_00240]